MSESVANPWALMRHHAGWADIFKIESESADSVTGAYPDRAAGGPPVNYSKRAVLARFETQDAARAAREGGVAEWRKYDSAVKEAEAVLTAAIEKRESAWLDWLQNADKA